MERYLKKQIVADLKRKMVFLGGPRQVGKTTLSKTLLKNKAHYFNWDVATQREAILKRRWPTDSGLLVFDELHKYRFWRGYLKGLFDEHKDFYQVLVTGSARLDYYRHGGDSLQGRYHFLRMHPLSLAELGGSDKTILDLYKLGGFPEPFFMQSSVEAKRWSLEYRTRLLREDLTGLEAIRDLGNLELLMLRLPDLTGSPLSINALREDLQVNHRTVAHWLDVLERLYAIFRLAPFGAPQIKAVKKEQKHYHFDWTLITNEGPRFENMVACHLLKWTHYLYDTQGRDVDLRYFRDVTGREVDFVMTEDRKPILFVEYKLSDDTVSPHLSYLKQRFKNVPAWQLSLKGKKDFRSADGIRVCPAAVLLKDLV